VRFHLSEVFLLAAAVILFRDFVITWFRERMPARSAKMPSLRSAKWKTAVFMVGSALVLLGTVDSSGLWPWIANFGTLAVLGSMGLALYSGYEYLSHLFLR
jgi:phosphatidylglycerophosphate synthase